MSEHHKRRSSMMAVSPAFGPAGAWQPAVDIYRTHTGWLLKFELAGVGEDDLAVEVQGNRLTVSGIRRDWNIEDCCAHYAMEIAYNRFERVIELPCNLEQAELSLELRQGILFVRVTSPGGRP
jgi:HSP20 family protein